MRGDGAFDVFARKLQYGDEIAYVLGSNRDDSGDRKGRKGQEAVDGGLRDVRDDERLRSLLSPKLKRYADTLLAPKPGRPEIPDVVLALFACELSTMSPDEIGDRYGLRTPSTFRTWKSAARARRRELLRADGTPTEHALQLVADDPREADEIAAAFRRTGC